MLERTLFATTNTSLHVYKGLRSCCMVFQWWKTLGQHALKFASQMQTGLFLPLFLLPSYLALHDLFRILHFIQLSINPESSEKGEGNIWVISGCCPLLLLQLAVRTNVYKQKSCVSKEANNKVLLEKKHHHCVLEGTLKSMLIASLERVYKVSVPEKCLADRCSDLQEEAVAFMSPSYLLIDTTWMRQAEVSYLLS